MNRVHNIDKELIIKYLKEGRSTRQIGSELNIPNTTLSAFIRTNNLQSYYKRPKQKPLQLDKIESKEMAYVLGFIIADGYINRENVEISIKKSDEDLMKFISTILGSKYTTDNTLDRKKKRHPRVRTFRKIKGINKFIGSKDKKEFRNVPVLSKNLEVYLVRGIFDGDGSISWGYRKDRNRIWHKISFTSSLSILTSIQKILYKSGISTTVKPKNRSNCFVLDFSNKSDVLKFYSYLYSDETFIPLERKFNIYNALRLELGEISETTYNSTILSGALDLSKEHAETSGELNGILNDHSSTQDKNVKI